MIDLVFNNFTKQKKYSLDFFDKILKQAVSETKLTQQNIGLSINTIGAGKMGSLNKTYRDKDTPTDVLSFPIQDLFYKSDFSGVGKNKTDAIIELGDIFICLEVATKKAKENLISLDEEVAFLVVHGFLHLLGYDHERSNADEKEMFDLQDKILKSIV